MATSNEQIRTISGLVDSIVAGGAESAIWQPGGTQLAVIIVNGSKAQSAVNAVKAILGG